MQALHQPYPKLHAVQSMSQCPSHEADPNSGPTIRISKRKRENDAAIEELSRLETKSKRRRINTVDDVDEPEADFALLLRKHSMSLHQGLQTHWTCVCQKCSGLSVRLTLPQRKESSQLETCFELFFGVRSLLTIALQEAKITVK